MVQRVVVLFGAALVLSLGYGCGGDNCVAGTACVCDGDCSETCGGDNQAGCSFSCAAGKTCSFSCPGGACSATGGAGASVTLSCAGNGCTLNCAGGQTCKITNCSSTCVLNCGGSTNCANSCGLGSACTKN